MGRDGVTASAINRAGHAGPNLYRADQPSACSDPGAPTAADSWGPEITSRTEILTAKPTSRPGRALMACDHHCRSQAGEDAFGNVGRIFGMCSRPPYSIGQDGTPQSPVEASELFAKRSPIFARQCARHDLEFSACFTCRFTGPLLSPILVVLYSHAFAGYGNRRLSRLPPKQKPARMPRPTTKGQLRSASAWSFNTAILGAWAHPNQRIMSY